MKKIVIYRWEIRQGGRMIIRKIICQGFMIDECIANVERHGEESLGEWLRERRKREKNKSECCKQSSTSSLFANDCWLSFSLSPAHLRPPITQGLCSRTKDVDSRQGKTSRCLRTTHKDSQQNWTSKICLNQLAKWYPSFSGLRHVIVLTQG